MKKLKITTFFVCLLATVAHGQSARQELKENLCRSASNFMAYPGPMQQRLTPAPEGWKPFCVSHYARHGSRYMTKLKEYDYLLDVLDRAHRLGKLSELGCDVLRRVRLIHAEGSARLGELTPLGVRQHRDIARRMAERFPEVFAAPNASVDARSTLVIRCVLSMEHELLQLVSMNPKLSVSSDATLSDAHFLSYTDKGLMKAVPSSTSRTEYDSYCQKHICWQRVVGQLFNDTAYVNHEVKGELVNYYLFRMASGLQNMELRRSVTLYDLFTDDEILNNWQINNAYWYLGFGFAPQTGVQQPYAQRHLLRRIISDADSCMRLDHPVAMLRFGHDTVLLPLVCLMGVNGYDRQVGNLEHLEKSGWVDYRVFPMAGNLQIIFYRRSPADQEVLLKVLLNEDEATLPLPAFDGPYYRWADFRDYYLKKLDAYKELTESQ